MKAYVYWLHLPEHTDIFTEGYIGVARDPEKRLKAHHYLIQSHWHENPHLYRAFEKYKEQIIQDIVIIGEENYCYEIETKLRPQKQIGWNIAEGGNKPPSNWGHTFNTGRKWPPETVEKRRQTMIKTLAEKFPIEERRNYNRSKAGSEEHKQKLSQKSKDIHANRTEEQKQVIGKKISESNKGKQNRLGQTNTPKHRAKASAAIKEALSKIDRSGTFWWNNGFINTRAKQSPGSEWIKGKLPHHKSYNSDNMKRVWAERKAGTLPMPVYD